MAELTYINSVEISDGKGGKKPVGAGDRVDLLPLNIPRWPGEKSTEFERKRNHDFLLRWLKKGPYRIAQIGMWPCGKVMLYLESPTGGAGPGAYAYDFMSVE